jgi:tetratricopeptide (TPR) repeat protein
MALSTDHNPLSGVLSHYVNRVGYTPGQLSRLTGIPKATTVNWLSGRVKKPRCRADLLRLAKALHLNEGEASELLRAAGYPAIPALMRAASEEEHELLNHWPQQVHHQPDCPPFQAIPDLPYFVGRQKIIQAVSQALLSNHHQSVYFIQGMPGVGKTSLAAKIAYQMRPYYPDGVLWARLDNSDPMSILDTFGRAYGLNASRYTDLDSRSRVLRELLVDKRVLMILDNANRSQEIWPLLPPTGPAAVLVTTQHQDLWAASGARRFLLGPFSQDEGHALVLFSRFLGEEIVLNQENIFAEMADLLGHHPLAIAIAASRLAYEPCWTPAEFLAHLREDRLRLDTLTFNDQSVTLSLESSYQTLPSDRQDLFTKLAVFGGLEFSTQAAAYVNGDQIEQAKEGLRNLYCLSFILSDRQNHYYLHPLIQDYALGKLEGREAHERMIDYYLQVLEEEQADFEAIELVEKNLHFALKSAHTLGIQASFVRAANAFCYFLEARGLHTTALAYLRQAEKAARGCGDVKGLARTLLNRGRMEHLCNHLDRAGQALCEALRVAQETQLHEDAIDVLSELGVLEILNGNYARAEQYLSEAVVSANAQGSLESHSMLFNRLGVVAFKRGNLGRARSFFTEGLAYARQLGDLTVIGAYLTNLGVVSIKLGENELGESYLQEALLLAERTGHKHRKCLLRLNLGKAALKRGDYAAAQMNLQMALEMEQNLEDLLLQASIRIGLGELRLKQKRLGQAAGLFRESLSIASQSGCKETNASALFGLARLEAARGQMKDALCLGQQSYEIFKSLHHNQVEEVGVWLQSIRETPL